MIRGNTPPCLATHKSLSPAIQFIRDLDASFILAPSKGLQLALRQRKWLHRLVTAEVLQPLFLHAFAMSHLFTNLRCIPLSVLLAFIGGVLLVLPGWRPSRTLRTGRISLTFWPY